MIKTILKKPDAFGSIASILCIVHCSITPFIFVVHTCNIGGCRVAPSWWLSLDYIFLLISLLAVISSIKKTSSSIIKPLMVSCWFCLFLLIVNEQMQFILLPHKTTYIAAVSLSLLHLYNMKYCQCKTSKCCTQHG